MSTHPNEPVRPRLAAAHRALVIVLPVLVLTQAALAGQHLFEGSSITLHGILGNVTFALTVVGVGLAVARRGDATTFAVGAAAFATIPTLDELALLALAMMLAAAALLAMKR